MSASEKLKALIDDPTPSDWDVVREALLPPYSGGKVWEGVGPTPRMDALAALDRLNAENERLTRERDEARQLYIEDVCPDEEFLVARGWASTLQPKEEA